MSGRSGSVVASQGAAMKESIGPGPYVTLNGRPQTLSGAQFYLFLAARYSGGKLVVSECEKDSAEALVLLGVALWTGEREITLVKNA